MTLRSSKMAKKGFNLKTHQSQYSEKTGWQSLPDSAIWNSAETLIFAFASPIFLNKPELFKQLHDQFPNATLVGCSTSGEIQGDQLFDSSISLTFIKFKNSQFRSALVPVNLTSDSRAAGKSLAETLFDSSLKAITILSDGLMVNGTSLVEGFKDVIDTSKIPLGGGLAGDGNNFQRTFVVYNGLVKSSSVVAVGFYGESIDISVSARGGWDIFGPNRTITKSSGNELFEIDGKPALDLYKEYLGDRAKDLPASGLLFPLQICPVNDPSKKMVRTILSINEHNKSLIFAGDVPQGWSGQLMRANFERVIDGASSAYESGVLKMNDKNSAKFVMAVSCVGRRLVLGERTSEEIQVIADGLTKDSVMSGFYSYGEIAPTMTGQSCELHNQTMTLFILTEKETAQARKAS